jgi:hypothetical protein
LSCCVLLAIAIAHTPLVSAAAGRQLSLAAIDLLPNAPATYQMRDWHETATIRISDSVGGGLDLPANTENFFFTNGSASSGGFVSELVSIPLASTAASWDIIFNTGDRSLANDTDPGKLDAMGTLFVDDVHARLPEPASLLLLSISGLMVMGRRRRD